MLKEQSVEINEEIIKELKALKGLKNFSPDIFDKLAKLKNVSVDELESYLEFSAELKPKDIKKILKFIIEFNLKKNSMELARLSLDMVSLSLPHLVGLTKLLRISTDFRIKTASIFASGRLLINPKWFSGFGYKDTTFIMAHELFHLMLKSHERAREKDALLFNIAQDYIINDMLEEELKQTTPRDGLRMPGARHKSTEELMQELNENEKVKKNYLKKAGNDVLSDEQEKEMFPGEYNPEKEKEISEEIDKEIKKAISIGIIKEKFEKLLSEKDPVPGDETGDTSLLVDSLNYFYKPPWELALQKWMEAVIPTARSYARPSRRGADRTDLVLIGKKREGWILNIILDTSGSMINDLPEVIGHIVSFCRYVNVEKIRLLQCDVEITRDDYIYPEDLEHFIVTGMGGSDMSPAMKLLAKDLEVESVIVLTDGYIYYPSNPVPYNVLWVLSSNHKKSFSPGYGNIIKIIR